MKQLKSALIGFLFLLVGVVAFAAEQNTANLNLEETVTIAGVQIAPGHYKVKWENNAAQTTLTIVSGKKVLVSVPAQVTQEPGPSSDNVALKFTEAGSAKTVTTVYTPKFTFVLESNATSASNGR